MRYEFEKGNRWRFPKGNIPHNISSPQRLKNFKNSIGEQVLLGAIIADGCLVKRSKIGGTYLQMCHSTKQKDYLEWKVKILKDFDIKFGKPYEIVKNNTILERSETYQEFNDYYRMFYRGRKKVIRRNILNLFQPIALAIWIQDDGSMCRDENIIRLHTECFSDREQKMICGYFASVWHITAKINWVSMERNLKCIAFGVNGTKKLIEIIKPFIISSMEYKIELIPKLSKQETIDNLIKGGIKTRFQKGFIPWKKKVLTTIT